MEPRTARLDHILSKNARRIIGRKKIKNEKLRYALRDAHNNREQGKTGVRNEKRGVKVSLRDVFEMEWRGNK